MLKKVSIHSHFIFYYRY